MTNDINPIDYMQAQQSQPITGSIAFRALVPKLEARIAELEAALINAAAVERTECVRIVEAGRWQSEQGPGDVINRVLASVARNIRKRSDVNG